MCSDSSGWFLPRPNWPSRHRRIKARASVQHIHTQVHTHTHTLDIKPESCSDCAAGCLHWLCDFLHPDRGAQKPQSKSLLSWCQAEKRDAWCSEQPSDCRRTNTASCNSIEGWLKSRVFTLTEKSDWREWNYKKTLMEDFCHWCKSHF